MKPLPLNAVLLAGGASLAVIASAPAVAETDAQVRVSVGAGIENNPYLAIDGSESAFSASISVEPSIYTADERSNFQVSGLFELREYEGDVPSNESASLSAGGRTSITERTSLNASANFRTSRNGAQDLLFRGSGNLLDLEQGEAPELEFIDPTIAGFDRRTTTYGADAGISHQLTEVSSLSLGASASVSETKGDFGRDYRRVGTFLGYSRQLSERTAVQLSANLSRSDFRDQNFGDAISLTTLVGLSQQVSERITWSFGVGTTYSEIDDGLGGTVDNTALAGNVEFCNRGERSSMCLAAARDASPTLFGGLTTSTSVGLSYSNQLTERDSLSASVSYRKSDSILDNFGFSQNAEFYGGQVQYRRKLARNFSAFASGGYSRTDGTTVNGFNSDNLRARVGLSYTFGGRE